MKGTSRGCLVESSAALNGLKHARVTLSLWMIVNIAVNLLDLMYLIPSLRTSLLDGERCSVTTKVQFTLSVLYAAPFGLFYVSFTSKLKSSHFTSHEKRIKRF